ncbi:MAG: hypothetical protein ABJ360_03535 [Roseobacter sp.]
MLKEPGNLSDLGSDAQKAWHDAIVNLVTVAQGTAFSDHFKLVAGDDWQDGEAVVDWDGFPKILENCLGHEKAAKFCDWKTPNGDLGRTYGQDEYLEWRTVRNSEGKLTRVEFTTELSKYWEILAGHHPMKTLRILGRFAGEDTADWQEVYGNLNPFAAGVTIAQRSSAFNRMMNRLRPGDQPVLSPYNNGQKAIAFLSKPVSSLAAAVSLFVRAASPIGQNIGGADVMLSGPEAIASTVQAAVDCRNSDPTMVGRMIQEVWNGSAIAFDDPIGVYIRNFAHETLLDGDGNSIPEDWVEYQRGSRPSDGEGQERSQRLVIEVPPGQGFVLGDLINKDTEERIEHGYQLAELVKVACYFRTSADGVITSPRNIVSVSSLADCSSSNNCDSWNDLYRDFEESTSMPAENMITSDRTGEL